MTSEIKVDTISEQTSANGVTIDGLTIKDGNIIGDVALAGTTPTFTIGDAGAEDAALIFDGNAQDFYIALDDSADDLIIGLGAAVGTTPMLSFTEAKAAAFTGAVTMASTLGVTGKITADAGIDIDNFNIDGTTIALSSGDITLDAAGRVDLSADDNGEVRLFDGSSMYAQFKDDDDRLKIQGLIQDKDVMIVGNDGGSEVTAVRFDMSEAGLAVFNAGIAIGGTGAANTLDDYEEGTWTPVLTSSGNAYGSVSHSSQIGYYTKVGRQVTAYFSIASTSVTVGSPTGNVIINGVPFTSQNAAGDCAGTVGYASTINANLSSFGTFHLGLVVQQNAARINFTRSRNNAGADGWPATAIGSGGFVITGSVTYFV